MESPVFARREVWEQVRDEIRRQIIVGELALGARLIETELAAQFSVSRGPVRTALQDLERVGLVVSAPRRAVSVVRFTQRDITELYSLREGLETLALREVTTPIDGATGARIEDHLSQLAAARARGASMDAVEADLAFHRELCLLGGNSRLLGAWENLADQLMIAIGSVHRIDPSVASDVGEHRRVVAALEAGDGAAAATALAEHLQASRRAMEQWEMFSTEDDGAEVVATR
jgi:DNA-binding GntR family transcriptional regulator